MTVINLSFTAKETNILDIFNRYLKVYKILRQAQDDII